jgi:hypothetical protein
MRMIRIGLPALIGAVLIFIAVQSTRTALGDYGESALTAVRGGLLPAAIGAGLLLAALAIARRTRLGYLLGYVVAAGMIAAGLALIAIELPYLASGGLTGTIAAALVVVALVWGLVWAGYAASFRRARATFAHTLEAGDRRFGIVLAGLGIATAATYLSLGVIVDQTGAGIAAGQQEASARVADTSVDISVVDVAFDPAPSDGSQAPVARLTLELDVHAAQAYTLLEPPRLCLTDAATFADPAFKPDTYCWGTQGESIALTDAFGDLTMPAAARTVRLELQRGDSLCAFTAGAWNADLRIEPLVGDSGQAGAYPIDVQIIVGDGAARTAGTSTCLGSLISH